MPITPLQEWLAAGDLGFRYRGHAIFTRQAGASDAPVESTDVLHAIQCCVTREGFETHQALSPAEALALYTRNAAYLQFEEGEKGTLAPGKRADLAILSANPLAVPPDRIASLRVLRTVAGGRVTHGDPDGDLR